MHSFNEHNPQVVRTRIRKDAQVTNVRDEHLGSIGELVVDTDSGNIAYAVLSFGGFMGLGKKLFAVPWSALTYNVGEEYFLLEVDRATLESSSGFDKGHWPHIADQGWFARIHGIGTPNHRVASNNMR